MSDWLDRSVEAASRDPKLVSELERVRELEASLLGGVQLGGGITAVRPADVVERARAGGGEEEEYNLILDRIAADLAEPGENPAEFAQWLSYHYEDVLARNGRGK